MNFSQEIINWYNLNKRDLPWRNTNDPYKIWLSEIILQQTKVDQGLPYYHKFCEKFPDIQSLANAKEEEILKLWQGLGYYSRARNLHFASKQIINSYDSKFPSKHKDILSLKGVGEYTAAAIASFAYNLPYAVVDGNVFRLLSRFYGINTPINSSAGKKIFAELAQSILDKKRANINNQSIMEFGALMCKPKNPNCNECPLKDSCKAFLTNEIDNLPVKIKNRKQKHLYFEYLFITHQGETYLNKRIEKGIWQNLYEFPTVEFDQKESEDKVKETIENQSFLKNTNIEIVKSTETQKHILSHRIIHGRLWHVESYSKLNHPKWTAVDLKSINKYPMSRLMEIFLESKFLINDKKSYI
jgi:A/G-specific adenine glycosylase